MDAPDRHNGQRDKQMCLFVRLSLRWSLTQYFTGCLISSLLSRSLIRILAVNQIPGLKIGQELCVFLFFLYW